MDRKVCISRPYDVRRCDDYVGDHRAAVGVNDIKGKKEGGAGGVAEEAESEGWTEVSAEEEGENSGAVRVADVVAEGGTEGPESGQVCCGVVEAL